MQKVRLIFAKSYIDNPTLNDTFYKDIEVELPKGMKQAHLIAARSYQPDDVGATIGGDINSTIISYTDESNIVGELLTYVDATFSDREQRDAQKSIVKNTVYGFFDRLRTRAVQTIDSHEAPKDSKSDGNYPL